MTFATHWSSFLKTFFNVFRILEFGKISVHGQCPSIGDFTFSCCCQKGQETKEGDRGKHIWRKKSVQPQTCSLFFVDQRIGKTVFLSPSRRMSGRGLVMLQHAWAFAKNSMICVNVRFSVLAGSTADLVWAYQHLCYHVLVKPSQIFHACVSSTFQFWNVAIFSGITYLLVEL